MFSRALKRWGLVAIACLPIYSCGDQGEDQEFPEIPQNEACDDFSLIGQMRLEGQFITGLIKCSALRGTDGSDAALQPVIELVDELGEDGIDQVIELLLTEKSAASLHPGRYPYLAATALMLDRGLGGSGGLDLSTRYSDLQSQLLSIDPYRAGQLLFSWQSSTHPVDNRSHLEWLLDRFVALLDLIPGDSIAAEAYSMLADPERRRLAREALEQILYRRPLMQALEGLFQMEKAPSVIEPRSCVRSWKNPRIAGEDGLTSLAPHCVTDPNAEPMNAADHLQKVVESIGAGGLADALTVLLDSYFSTEPMVRLRRVDGLLKGLSDLNEGSPAAFEQLTYIVDFLASTPLAEMQLLFSEDGMVGRLLLDNDSQRNIITLKPLGTKIGATEVSNHLTQWLLEGGKAVEHEPDDCGGYTLDEGLNQLLKRGAGENAVATVLTEVLTPRSDCPHGLSPLLSKVIDGRCSEECFTEISRTALMDIAPLTNPVDQVAPPERIAQLVSIAFERISNQTSRDPYALYSRKLARGKITQSQWQEIQDQLQQLMTLHGHTPRGLAAVDLEFSRISRQRADAGVLVIEDFLETLLFQEVQRLYRIEDEFKNLVSSSPAQLSEAAAAEMQQRLQRLFLGTYEDGPAKRVFAEAPTQAFGAPISTMLEQGPDHHAALSLSKLRYYPGIFQSSRVIPGRLTLSHGGDKKLSAAAGYRLTRTKTPQFTTDPGDGSFEMGALLPEMQLQGSDLVNLDTHPQLMAKINNFSRERDFVTDFNVFDGFEGVTQKSYLRGCAADSGCPFTSDQAPRWLGERPYLTSPYHEFLSPERSYTTDEMRQLLFYYAQHYGQRSFQLPTHWQGSAIVDDRPAFDKFLDRIVTSDYLSETPWAAQQAAWPPSWSTAPLAEWVLPNQLINLSSDFHQGSVDPSDNSALWGVKRSDTPLGTFALMNPLQRKFLALGMSTTSGKKNSRLDTLQMLMPLAGFNSSSAQPSCYLDVNPARREVDIQPHQCPIEVVPLAQETAAEALHQVLADRLFTAMCPYLASLNQPNDQRHQWLREVTALNASSVTCQQHTEPEADLAPSWFWHQFFKDIHSLGLNPKVEAGWHDLSLRIRYHKLRRQPLADARGLVNAPITFSSTSAAWRKTFSQDNYVFDYVGGWVDAYLGITAQLGDDGALLTKDLSWEHIYASWGSPVDHHGFKHSEIIRYLKRLQNRFENTLAVNPNHSLLAFLLEELEYLNQDTSLSVRQLRHLAALITDPNSFRSLEIYGALNGALDKGYKHFFTVHPRDNGSTEAPDSWEGLAAMELLKFQMRPENLRPISQLLNRFSIHEVVSFFQLMQDTMEALGRDSQQRVEAVRALNGWLSGAMASRLPDGLKVHSFSKQMREISRSLPDQAGWLALDSYLSVLTQPQTAISGNQQVPGLLSQQLRRDLSEWTIQHALEALETYQDKQRPQGFTHQMLLGLLGPIFSSNEPTALGNLLKEPVLGLVGERFVGRDLLELHRPQLLAALRSLDRAQVETLLKATTSSPKLLADLNPFLKLVRQSIEFTDPQEAEDFMRSIEALYLMSSNQHQGDLALQIELASRWLLPQQHEPQLAEYRMAWFR